ncbi:MAG: hypothetical protein WC985_08505 [Thermoplasmata archaeon]
MMGRALKCGKDPRKNLEAFRKAHGKEAAEEVLKWLESDDKDARFLRSDRRDPFTVWRPGNAGRYLDKARMVDIEPEEQEEPEAPLPPPIPFVPAYIRSLESVRNVADGKAVAEHLAGFRARMQAKEALYGKG